MRRQSTSSVQHDRHRGVAASTPALAQSGDGIDYATAHLDRKVLATRATGPISINGVLDEPAWANAPVAHDFIQNDPREGEPATHDTEVRVLLDDQAIYFGVFAKDAEPGAIIISDLKKDFNTGNSDGFRVIIDTFADQRNGYQFAINPAGAEVGRADVERRAREQRQLGRRLGRQDENHRDRLVRGDPDSVPHAQVPRGRSADLGSQLRAQAAAAERRQLLVAAAAHLQPGARLAGRHDRRPARPASRQEPAVQALRARRSSSTIGARPAPTAISPRAST